MQIGSWFHALYLSLHALHGSISKDGYIGPSCVDHTFRIHMHVAACTAHEWNKICTAHPGLPSRLARKMLTRHACRQLHFLARWEEQQCCQM